MRPLLLFAVLFAIAACSPSPKQRVDRLWKRPPHGADYTRVSGPLSKTARAYFADDNATVVPIGRTADGRVCGLVQSRHGRHVMMRAATSTMVISEEDAASFRTWALTFCRPFREFTAARAIDLEAWRPQTSPGPEAEWNFRSFAAMSAELEDRQKDLREAAVLNRMALAERLVSPKSAKFEPRRDGSSCGYVTSLNRMGVPVRQRYLGAALEEEIGSAKMSELWARECAKG